MWAVSMESMIMSKMSRKTLMNRGKRKLVVRISGFVLILAFLALACMGYLRDYYRADFESIETFIAKSDIQYRKINDHTVVWEPEGATKGLIFYPGGKVESAAYIPLLQTCAEQDILCVLIEMPFHLAVLDVNAADGIQEQYPDVEEWYIGGHSLGGSMAASYMAGHTDQYEGLILLGSYSTANLSGTDLRILSVFGSEDQVMNRENYEENKSNLSSAVTEIILDGGCHAYFGMYGEQDGDGTPRMTCEEQIRETAMHISNFIEP